MDYEVYTFVFLSKYKQEFPHHPVDHLKIAYIKQIKGF